MSCLQSSDNGDGLQPKSDGLDVSASAKPSPRSRFARRWTCTRNDLRGSESWVSWRREFAAWVRWWNCRGSVGKVCMYT